VHFVWPIPWTRADLPMMPVVLLGLAGLYVFIHGLLLQRGTSGEKACAPATMDPLVSSPREIVRLSPDGASDLRTQQGKVAAALMKSGASITGPWTSSALRSTNNAQPFRWKPALMVWSGPILTLISFCLLALHFHLL
jgi:hypothetical protein